MNTTIHNILVHKWTYLGEVGNNVYAISALNSFIYAIKHALLIYFQQLPPFQDRIPCYLRIVRAFSLELLRGTLCLLYSLCCPRAA
jgi:hypothetical protein